MKFKNKIKLLFCKLGFHHETTKYHKKHPAWGGRNKMRVYCMNCKQTVWVKRRK